MSVFSAIFFSRGKKNLNTKPRHLSRYSRRMGLSEAVVEGQKFRQLFFASMDVVIVKLYRHLFFIFKKYLYVLSFCLFSWHYSS